MQYTIALSDSSDTSGPSQPSFVLLFKIPNHLPSQLAHIARVIVVGDQRRKLEVYNNWTSRLSRVRKKTKMQWWLEKLGMLLPTSPQIRDI